MAELRSLRALLENYERSQPGTPFNLGRVDMEVVGTATRAPRSESLSGEQAWDANARTLPDALNLVPGVSVQRVGARNERGIFARSFDLRQVPLYMDGILVYLPYDGYIDLDRFLTYDVGEVQVVKGFTSVFYVWAQHDRRGHQRDIERAGRQAEPGPRDGIRFRPYDGRLSECRQPLAPVLDLNRVRLALEHLLPFVRRLPTGPAAT